MALDIHKGYHQQVPYTLLVKTNSYAGNFEREMCSWVTGYEGEYFPGGIEHIVEQANEELGDMAESIAECFGTVDDEHGEQVVTMTGGDFQSVAIFFDELPSQEEIDTMIARAKTFPKVSNTKKLKILDVQFVENQTYNKLLEEVKELRELNDRLSALLTKSINAVRGDPPPMVQWSWHDLPERILFELGNE